VLILTTKFEFIAGPQEWPQHFPSCGARQQSPINIDSDNTLCHIYPPFVFKHYDKVRMASFLENGHTGDAVLDNGHVTLVERSDYDSCS
jgi:Eukaryotic-type carbonic anhydrase